LSRVGGPADFGNAATDAARCVASLPRDVQFAAALADEFIHQSVAAVAFFAVRTEFALRHVNPPSRETVSQLMANRLRLAVTEQLRKPVVSVGLWRKIDRLAAAQLRECEGGVPARRLFNFTKSAGEFRHSESTVPHFAQLAVRLRTSQFVQPQPGQAAPVW
jgi:hypothetical protein